MSIFFFFTFVFFFFFFFFSSRRRHTRSLRDWSSDVCSSDLRISAVVATSAIISGAVRNTQVTLGRSEEHTSELQSRRDLVCRLLLEKKNKKKQFKPSSYPLHH